LLVGLPAAALADDQAESVALIGRLYRTAAGIAQGTEPSAKPSAVLRRSFDAPAIARKVLGEYWTRADVNDRRMSIEYAQDAIAQATVRHLGRANREDFGFLDSRRLANGDVLVATQLTRPSGRMTRLEWRIHRCTGGPCIIDLFIDGASLSIQRRDEFAALMRSGTNSIGAAITAMRSASIARSP
jgi:ABC-type transporter MlaC component